MRTITFLQICVFIFAIVACKPKTKMSDTYIRVDLTWDGASAEFIEKNLFSMGESMKLAVIDDGRASLYFKDDLSTLESHLKHVKEKLPSGIQFTPLTKIEASIPRPPCVLTHKYVRDIQIDRGAVADAGVSISDISALVAKLPEPVGATESVEILKGVVVPSFKGKNVTLDTLVQSTLIPVARPLIIENR